jgi:hypothetical protein
MHFFTLKSVKIRASLKGLRCQKKEKNLIRKRLKNRNPNCWKPLHSILKLTYHMNTSQNFVLSTYNMLVEKVFTKSLSYKFCNDSFKLPLCLYFHPKIIAAACILFAARWRKSQGLDPGISTNILGHPWYKWIDSSIE